MRPKLALKKALNGFVKFSLKGLGVKIKGLLHVISLGGHIGWKFDFILSQISVEFSYQNLKLADISMLICEYLLKLTNFVAKLFKKIE